MSGKNDGCFRASLDMFKRNVLVRRDLRVMVKHNRRAFALAAIAAAVAGLLYIGHAYGSEYNLRLDAQLAHASLRADVLKLARFGAPGFVRSDFVDGTATMGEHDVSFDRRQKAL